MSPYDLHRQQVNFSMVSAHYVLKSLYKEFGAETLKETIRSFESRDSAKENTPVIKGLAYSKGSDLVMR